MREFFNRMKVNPQSARKFIAALLGALATAVTVGVIQDPYAAYVAVAIAFATSLGVYAVPNERINEDE